MRALGLLLLLCWTPPVLAETRSAPSCSREDVSAAMDAALDGDTILIPAGTCTWTAGITWSRASEGDRAFTLQGAGASQTHIDGPGDSYAFDVYGSFSGLWRWTGIDFTDGKAIELRGGTVLQYRIDHCSFTNHGSRVVQFGPADAPIYERYNGVMDHCTFHNNNAEGASGAVIRMYWSNQAWNEDPALGNGNAMFFEDNAFVYDNCAALGLPWELTASNAGAKYVFRHNTLDVCYRESPTNQMGTILDVHGECQNSVTNGEGGRSIEAYDNTFTSQHSWVGVYVRGGKGVITNNTFAGDFTIPLYFRDYAYCHDSLCSGTNSYTCGAYPCDHQVSEVYVWSNTGLSSATVASCSADVIQEDRDYFMHAMPGYAPYPYPHPLAQDSQGASAGKKSCGCGTGAPLPLAAGLLALLLRRRRGARACPSRKTHPLRSP